MVMDKSKIHPNYYGVYDQVMKAEFIPQAEKERLYKIWVEINKHPKEHWKKKSVLSKLEKIK